jgi:hypothetical protein
MGDNFLQFENHREIMSALWDGYSKLLAMPVDNLDKGKTLINFKSLLHDILSFGVYSTEKWNELDRGLTETSNTEE